MSEMYRLHFKVRDYECDLQGIVNNSVYQNYLEHTRHEFLLTREVSFSDLAKRGVNLVVTRIEIDFKSSLRSGDEFYVTLNTERVGRIRGLFTQNIYRLNDEQDVSDDRQTVAAKVYWAAINDKGRPFFPEELEKLFESN